MRIDGRVFIVTGASSGIDLATARALVARSTQALEDLATTLPGSLAVTADMTDVDGIRRRRRQPPAQVEARVDPVHGDGRTAITRLSWPSVPTASCMVPKSARAI